MNKWRDAPNEEWRVSKSQEGGKAKGMEYCDELWIQQLFEGEMVRRKIHNYNRLHVTG